MSSWRPMRLYHRLTQRSARLTSFDIGLRLRLAERRGRAAVIVYQMGKVGSSTVVSSLRASGLQQSIHHIHSLTGEGFDSRKHMYERMFPGQPIDLQRMRHMLVSEQLQKRLARTKSQPKWKVITLVRDPVARNISDFFQVIDYWFPDFDARFKQKKVGIDELMATFIRDYHHNEPLDWFDHELKEVLGVDVFATQFAKSKGYEIYRQDNIEVMAVKLEKLNECAEAAFGDFLGLNDVHIVKANDASNKDYHQIYKQFQSDIKLPLEYLERMYKSKYGSQFYTPEEIQKFTARWQK